MLQRVNDRESGRQPGRSEYVDHGAVATWSRLHRWPPAILSTTSGAVNIIGFSCFGGLFTAHITGNLVVVASHYVTGGFGQVGPTLAVPVFITVPAVLVPLFGGIGNGGKTRRALLVLHAALLAGCLTLGVTFGLFSSADSPVAVLAGMLALAAMATQNALVKLALVESPSTAVMTTNTTQLIVDVAALVRNAEAPDNLGDVRQRARVTFLCMVGFVGGCVAGAAFELRFGIGAGAAGHPRRARRPVGRAERITTVRKSDLNRRDIHDQFY